MSSRPEARENTNDQVTIGLSFVSDWLKEWRVSRPITGRSETIPMQSCTAHLVLSFFLTLVFAAISFSISRTATSALC